MKYSEHLRKVFKDSRLDIEDLLLLECFQIRYLPERVPAKEFATLLREYPVIHRFLIKKEPSIKSFLDKIKDYRFKKKLKKLEQENGIIDWAANLIETSDKWKVYFNKILSGTLVVENFDVAISLSKKYPEFDFEVTDDMTNLEVPDTILDGVGE